MPRTVEMLEATASKWGVARSDGFPPELDNLQNILQIDFENLRSDDNNRQFLITLNKYK